MGNTATRSMWNERMYAERDQAVNYTMVKMRDYPIVSTFDEKWFIDNVFKHHTLEKILDEQNVWALPVCNYSSAEDYSPKTAFKMRKKLYQIDPDNWYHLVVTLGELHLLPRFRISLDDTTAFFDTIIKKPYVEVACLYNPNLAIDIGARQLYWVYPTLHKRKLVLVVCPHKLNSSKQLSLITSDYLKSINIINDNKNASDEKLFMKLRLGNDDNLTIDDLSKLHLLVENIIKKKEDPTEQCLD